MLLTVNDRFQPGALQTNAPVACNSYQRYGNRIAGMIACERHERAGYAVHADGTISGVSVNSANGKTIEQLAGRIPNSQVGVATVGNIRTAGGNVIPRPTASNPDHCELYGITAKKAEELFTPTQKNWK